MDVWEMALRLRNLAGENAKANAGKKSPEYKRWRQELINCVGKKRAVKLIKEAFEATAGFGHRT